MLLRYWDVKLCKHLPRAQYIIGSHRSSFQSIESVSSNEWNNKIFQNTCYIIIFVIDIIKKSNAILYFPGFFPGLFPQDVVSMIFSHTSSHTNKVFPRLIPWSFLKKLFTWLISQISYVHFVFSMIFSQVSYVNHKISQVSPRNFT